MTFFQSILAYALIIILFIFYYFFGLAIVKRFAKKLSKKLINLELISISLFIGLFFQVWISFIIALIIKNIIIAHILSILAATLFIFYNRRHLGKVKILNDIDKHKIAFMLFLVITIILLFTVFFRFEGGKIYTAPPNYGDWALHITLINSFANGNNIPPMYTFYSGTRLGYSFLNFYANALLVNLGLDIFYAFNTFQVILTFSLLLFTYLLGIRLFGKKTYALLFSILLFFGGGLGWIYIFESNESFLSTISNNDYYVMHSENILPINLSIHSYSMRTGLLGWIYLIIIFILIFNEVFKLKKWKALKEYAIVISLLGGLFLFHSYSFLIITIFLFFIWIQRPIKSFFLLLLGSGILALPQLLWTRSQTMKQGFFRFIHGLFVSITQPTAFLWLWLKNFGGMLLFVIFGFKKYKHLWLPFLGFFVIGNTILLQPWDFDNNKLLISCYFILAIFGVMGIKYLWELKKKTKLGFLIRSMTVLVIIIVLLPSFLGTYHYYKQKALFSSREDQALGELIGDITPIDSVILTGTQHNHPVFLYSGRKVFEGYRGWIWTHGLDMDARDKETKAMFESNDKNEACKLFKKNNVDYIFISDWERREDLYNVNEGFFVDNFKILYNKDNNLLFKIKC